MWIIPNNYPLYSAFAQDMVASKEDLTLLESSIESSLMWRSKPSRLHSWLQRWNGVSWLRHLFGRTLKPSRQKSFEIALTSLLEAIPVRDSPKLDGAKELKTNDTSGRLSGMQFDLFDLVDVSSKTSRDTLRWDSPLLSQIWRRRVIEQRGEYSQRLKSALRTRGRESSLWLTPRATDTNKGEGNSTFTARMGDRTENVAQSLPAQVNNPRTWPTPSADQAGEGPMLNELLTKEGEPAKLGERAYHPGAKYHSQITLNRAVQMFPTPDERGFTNDGSLEKLARSGVTKEEYEGMAYRAGRLKKGKFWPKPRARKGWLTPQVQDSKHSGTNSSENESTSWLTVSVEDAGRQGSAAAWREYKELGRTAQARLRNQVQTTQDNNQVKGKDKRGTTLGGAVRNWPKPRARRGWLTPQVQDSKHSGTNSSENGQRDLLVNQVNWPTPRALEDKDCGPVGSKSQLHMEKRSYLCAKAKDPKRPTGQLNPNWVEQLMGVPPGWTALDGTSNEWQYGWHDGSWEEGIPRVVESCPDRVDRIRLLGNGVVPQTAAKAWRVLEERLERS